MSLNISFGTLEVWKQILDIFSYKSLYCKSSILEKKGVVLQIQDDLG